MAHAKCLVVLALVVLAVGCSAGGGGYQSQNVTSVDLTHANYKVLKSSAVGTSYGFKLFCVIPFSSPTYGRAMNDLRKQAPMEGKATAVTNVTQDNGNIWLLLFSLPKITVTGDIVEFTDGAPPAAKPEGES